MRQASLRDTAPTRHLDRYRQVATVLTEEGLGWLVAETGLSRLVPGGAHRRRSSDPFTPEQHLRHALERLGVTFIKGGQAFSTRTDILWPSLATELAKLQDEVTPTPFETMRSVLETDLEMPLDRAFASFDPVAIGTASIGQVYRATLPDGTPVAVKVQRPELKDQVETDLDITLTIARRAQGRLADFAGLDVVGLIAEFADALRGELDYLREARNSEQLRREFEGDENVVVPRVHWTHTGPRVLTTDLLDGVRMNRIDELDAAGCDRPTLALAEVDAYLKMIFEIGFFHADPHPGNFIALSGNRIGFTDFGRVGAISTESRERFVDLLGAMVNRDEQAATEVLVTLSSNPDIDERALRQDVSRLIGRYHGRELGRISPTDLFGDTLSLMRNNQLAVPTDFALTLSTLTVLEGVGTTLDPAFDFAPVAAPFVERVVRRRYGAGQLVERLGTDLRRTGRVLERAPAMVDEILRRTARGEFGMEVTLRDYERPLDKVTELVNRVAFAIVVAALIIGASSLIGETRAPQWLTVVGEVGLVAAFLVSFWFFGSIIAAHYRAGRKR